ncbi:MAG: site-2 protease family protein [Chloroflexota bacterium]
MLLSNASLPVITGILVALVIGITFHEFSHAALADALGDHRPRALGRVSLNPLRHLEPVGALFFLIAGFGWGKPVPVNGYALRPGPIGMTIVAGAGPIANFAMAAVFAVVFRGFDAVGLLEQDFVRLVLASIVYFNVLLGFFNLLPIPPLDGYNVMLPLLPPRQQFVVQRYAQFGYLVLLALVVFSYGPTGGPLQWLFGVASSIAGAMIGTGVA